MKRFVAIFIGYLISWSYSFAAQCPCDIYDAAATPCVAAHSTVRALYSSYNGPLYQVTRKSDKQTKDIGVLTPGGFANAAAQDSFLNGKPGNISIIYDQSPKGNHLKIGPGGKGPLQDLHAPDSGAAATALKLKVGGHTVYGVFTTSRSGYRNDSTKGIATGEQPEGMYMVTSGKHVSDQCCFDYGNACTNDSANANGTLETIYFGTCGWWGKGIGAGPWVMVDLENGLYAGGTTGVNQNSASLTNDYVTAMLKGKTGNMALKGGNAQSGTLKTMHDGPRPPGYDAMLKQGGIVLGIGGDNSNWGFGTFFEGCMTSGYPSDSAENAVQANIVAAGYGGSVFSTRHIENATASSPPFRVRYNQSTASAVISFTMQDARHVDMIIVDQRGRRIDAIVNRAVTAGRHEAVWNAKQVPAGVYFWRISIDGSDGAVGKIVVGK
ncbi:MAG TPA: arabinofuranosidase catalytic domain-containing protein [Chitinivibrionales bacterium]